MSVSIGGLKKIGQSGGGSNGAQAGPGSVTTAAMAIYVDGATGSDSNIGSQASPLATIQAAVSLIPKHIYHGVDINLAAGSYAGALLDGFTVHSPASSDIATVNPYLSINGTLSAVTPATGPGTGTVSSFVGFSNATFAVVTDSTQTWTVNDLVGKFFQLTGGTGYTAGLASPNIYVIVSNTSTTATICSLLVAGALDATTTYQISTTSTIMTTAYPTSASSVNSPAATSYSSSGTSDVMFTNCVGAGFSIQRLQFSLGTSNPRGILMGGTGRLRVYGCRLIGAAGAANGISCITNQGPAGVLQLRQNYFGFTSGVGTCVQPVGSTGGSSLGYALDVGQCFFSGGLSHILAIQTTGYLQTTSMFSGSSSVSFGISGCPAGQITTSRWTGCGTGINVGNGNSSTGVGPSTVSAQACDISSCTVGVSVSTFGFFQASATAVTGTANTTALSLTAGGRAKIGSGTTMTGTTEVSIDGVSNDYATMRAASPKLITNTYGTIYHE